MDNDLMWASSNLQLPISEEVERLCDNNYSLKDERQHILEAKKAGMEIVRGNDRTLLFDLDGEIELETFKSRVGILEKKGFSPKVEISKSKNGNYHAIVRLGMINNDILSEPLRIAIQCCLGSDWKREFLGVLRYLNNQREVSMLFRPQPLEKVKWRNYGTS